MTASEIALPIRPGEHACCRFARAADRERLTMAFIRAGLERRQKVVYMHREDDKRRFVDRLMATDERVRHALATRQLELRQVRTSSLPEGSFDRRGTVISMRDDQRDAIARGYAGLAVTGDLVAVYGEPGTVDVVAYERDLDANGPDPANALLCHYRTDRLSPHALSVIARHHDVDASPELASIGRDGDISAARVRGSRALRLAGELDFNSATAVGDVIDAHFHGPLRLDLADVTYIDVAGMRTLRGGAGRRVEIDGASDAVRRLALLLGWDTDPGVHWSRGLALC